MFVVFVLIGFVVVFVEGEVAVGVGVDVDFLGCIGVLVGVFYYWF